ncbi:hypothetical protein BRC77_02385 [Halobacteriales archaeon QH_8_64_26]|nr:MAG: hypothetical protein BRC77_02385 [Halobacteriales archaeon QH_8_64_26]
MPEGALFEFGQVRTRVEIIDRLRSLADELDSDGSLTLAAESRQATLTLPDSPGFGLETEREYNEDESHIDVESTEGSEEGSTSGDDRDAEPEAVGTDAENDSVEAVPTGSGPLLETESQTKNTQRDAKRPPAPGRSPPNNCFLLPRRRDCEIAR